MMSLPADRPRPLRPAALMWLAVVVLLSGPAHAVSLLDMDISLTPAESALSGRLSAEVPAAHASPLRLRLDEAFTITGATVNGTSVPPPGGPGDHSLPLDGPGPWRITVDWRGVLPGPRPPAVGEDGSFLPGGLAWHPVIAGAEDAIPARLSVRTPAGQRAAVTGSLISESLGRTEAVAVFAPYADELPSVFAGPFAVRERMAGDLRLRTYFPAEADPLAEAYLDDTAAHIAHFSDLLGPFPYTGFAVVAAPYPVGYGFPGLTYVSERILALPFLRARSLPHEIVHSWWGNSVRPDYARGNWAEGLTTYLADYGLASPPEQAAMRLSWLRDLAALPAERDMPVVAFTAKAHGADQVVGYGKAAFVFHMLERRIGADALHAGLRRFYAAHRGGVASWDDLRAAVEAEAGESLETFFTQWLTRTGAPRLHLEAVEPTAGGVRLTLRQDTPPHDLRLPVRVVTTAGPLEAEVTLSTATHTATIATPADAQAVTVDPGHHVMRHLWPQETPPILRDVMLAATVTVSWPDDAAARDDAHPLVARLIEGRVQLAGAAHLVLRVGEATEDVPAEALSHGGTAWVWAERTEAGTPRLTVHARDAEALAALTRPLPHYGRESWLAFEHSRLLASDTWSPEASPLHWERH